MVSRPQSHVRQHLLPRLHLSLSRRQRQQPLHLDLLQRLLQHLHLLQHQQQHLLRLRLLQGLRHLQVLALIWTLTLMRA